MKDRVSSGKVVVTGAKGQLGRELCMLLGDRAVPWDIDTLDLTDRSAIFEQVEAIRPEILINCAAHTLVDKAESEPDVARAVNARAVESLAEACRQIDCLLVQISTDYVFGREPCREGEEGGERRPWREEDPTSPLGVYARTKWEGEQAASKLEKHLIVRTSGLYARPSDVHARNFVKTILRLADTQPMLRVVNDQFCSPSYVPHVARAVLFLAGIGTATSAPWGIYHVVNRGSTTFFDFAATILCYGKRNVPLHPITSAEFGAPAPRPAYSVLDTRKYHALGGPEMPFWDEAIREYFSEE